MVTTTSIRLLRGQLACAALLACFVWAPSAAAQPTQSVTSQEMTTYKAFRDWLGAQPKAVQEEPDAAVYERYAAELRKAGKSENEINATVDALRAMGDRAEVEMWNRVLTSPTPHFNTAANTFLVEVTKGLTPGRSLDVGMGQGRNTIYLAQQGWDSVGFDPADRAVAAAQAQAAKMGVKITTSIARVEDYKWSDAQWDLIVLSYVGARGFNDKVIRALKPGGMVVVEAFHRDALKSGPIGADVVFDTNELLQLFAPLRVVRYEDTEAVADFGLEKLRVVRLAAIKP